MYRVLIVDDETPIREGLRVLIKWEEHGFEAARLAGNGAEALEALEGGRFDAVVTDIRMPYMDGLEFIRTIRERGWPQKVVVISGYGDFEYAQKAIEYGVKDYLLKPIDPKKLLSAMLRIKRELDDEAISRNLAAAKKLDMLLHTKPDPANMPALKKCAEGLNLQHGAYAFSVLVAEPEEDWGSEGAEYAGNAYCRLNGLLGSEGFAWTLADSSGISAFVAVKRGCEELINDAAGAMQECVKESCYGEAAVAAGAAQYSFDRVYDSFCGASLALIFKDETADPSPVLLADAHAPMGPASLWEPERLAGAVQDLNNEAAVAEIKALFLHVLRGSRAMSAAYGAVYDALLALDRLARRLSFPLSPGLFLENAVKQMHGARSFRELFTFLSGYCFDLMEEIRHARGESSDSLILKIREHIAQNYPQDINIKSLSKVFSYNPTYLGRLFYTKEGVKLKDYINAVRIDKSVELIAARKYKIAEIAEMVGYKDIKHFYGMFRKAKGCTPSEYKSKV